MFAIARQSINACPYQEMGASFARSAEELIDVVFAIADVDQALAFSQQSRGGAHILQPADTFLGFDRHPRRIYMTLKCRGTFEFAAGPDLIAAKPSVSTAVRFQAIGAE
ncbi:MAG: hypothetical protein ACSLE1_02630 [Sphingobium sp.]